MLTVEPPVPIVREPGSAPPYLVWTHPPVQQGSLEYEGCITLVLRVRSAPKAEQPLRVEEHHYNLCAHPPECVNVHSPTF